MSSNRSRHQHESWYAPGMPFPTRLPKIGQLPPFNEHIVQVLIQNLEIAQAACIAAWVAEIVGIKCLNQCCRIVRACLVTSFNWRMPVGILLSHHFQWPGISSIDQAAGSAVPRSAGGVSHQVVRCGMNYDSPSDVRVGAAAQGGGRFDNIDSGCT